MHMFYLSSRVTDEARSIWEKGFLILESFSSDDPYRELSVYARTFYLKMGWWVILKTTSFSLSPPLTFLLWYVFMIHSACHAETYWEILRGRKETRFSCLLLLQLSYPSLPYYHVTQIFPLICSLWWQTLLAGHWQMGNQGNHRKYYDPTLANCIKILELIFPCASTSFT